MASRIEELRAYLIKQLTELKDFNQINANWLSNEPNNYSIDKIPTASTEENWVVGKLCRDVYNLRSQMENGQDTITNLKNIGFFEEFEDKINSNNSKGILPNIKGIQSIECLNCGTVVSATENTAELDIQIQITYIKEE